MVGLFEDDRLQTHVHTESFCNGLAGTASTAFGGVQLSVIYADGYHTENNSGRSGATTHGKQKGVKFIIKVL